MKKLPMKSSVLHFYKSILQMCLLFILGILLGLMTDLGVRAATVDRAVANLANNPFPEQTISSKTSLNTDRLDGIPSSRNIFTAEALSPDTQLQNGKELYQAGQYLQAVDVWKSATSGYETEGDKLNKALALSYLSLAYQQIGEIQQAETVMSEAIALITTQKLPESKFTIAQILNNQGQLKLSQGKPETALETWKKAEKYYKEAGDRIGEIGTQLNQAKALQALGFYLRARTTLQQVEASLASENDSQLKVVGLLNLGNILRVIGDYPASQKALDGCLAMAKKLQFDADVPIVSLELGNLAEAQQQSQTALEFYRQAAAENSSVRLQAQIRQLDLLVQLDRPGEAEKVLPFIQSQLANLPVNQTTIYAQIELAESLVKLTPKETTTAAKLLATAQQQAKSLGNPRAESYALGRLGKLYEQTQQWEDAKKLTQQALNLAQAINAQEIAYQWEWQMGRLFAATANGNNSDPTRAIASYTEAVNTLQSLRQDLVTINQDVQFSFRESIEPVYRELVDLLLRDNPNISEEQQQQNIVLARSTIEALQLAELANFFREACLDSKPQSIDSLDRTAAVIYPIILPDRLEVILSLPGKPLRHYATPLPQEKVEEVVSRMRQSLRRTSFPQERLAVAQQIYTWLVQPALADLTRQSIETLVFVLDGSLRNVPMAALYDGKQYLLEQYRIAIAPSLQLLTPRPIARNRLKVLVGGLTQGNQEFSPLPGVKQEVDSIETTVPTTILLDGQFTAAALQSEVKTPSFSVIHLATHGQFSSNAEKTFILAWDKPLDVKQFNTLLSGRDLSNSRPIELLVLSACQTAQGDKRAALGLAGVAVRSGARSTLATLWTVSDESTADFMSQFYKELLKPEATKAEAVRLAQIHVLKKPEFSHPYYWAPFILVGNWV